MLKPALLLTSLLVVGLTVPAYAQNSGAFTPVTIRPKFKSDPLKLEGVAGGNKPAKAIAGTIETPTGACLGFIDDQPDHTLEIKDFFSYLSIVAESDADTTIVVKGPGGTWCNDDFQGKNAGVSGEWLAGKYDVWVGTYAKKKTTAYQLKISEIR
jgi:hypothetical protein